MSTGDGGGEDDREETVPVVGIGASAGGLEAFRDLLEALPSDTGVAYVYLQHMARDQDSRIAETLAGSTEMPVRQIGEDETADVEPDHVYVNPPGGTLLLDGDRLRVEPRPDEGDVQHVVDDFMVSLAEARGARAVGVVLSGTLSDGTRGLREIRAAGGFTLAQDPRTTRFRGMPESAIRAGYADRSLAPAKIAGELERLAETALRRDPKARKAGVPEPDDESLKELFDIVEDHVGVDFAHYKRSTLKRRLHRRMLATGTESFPAYVDLLREDPGEVQTLYDEFLIQVTEFFRDDAAVETLKEVVIPELLEDRDADEPIRVWVPGCAQGEEAYSIAIMLADALDRHDLTHPVQVFGTDVSDSAITEAREGRYPEAIRGDVPDEILRRFFTETDGSFRVSKRIRSMCVFAVQDVTTDPPFSEMDVISCRNLLIYMEANLQKRVASSLHYALKADGFLQLGESESLDRFHDMFDGVKEGTSLYRKREVSPPPIHDFVQRPTSAPTGAPAEGAEPRTWTHDRLRLEAKRKLLDRYAPPAVIVNRDLDVLEFRGEVTPYLKHTSGEPSFKLMQMARQDLSVELNRALDEVRETGDRVVHRDVRIEQPGGDIRTVDVEIEPFHGPGDQESGFVIAFHEERDEVEPERTQPRERRSFLSRVGDKLVGKSTPKTGEKDAEIERLRDELEATREYLQSVIDEYEATTEELRSANEEALSANEELQSTNEELQTAKEELQSTNEELRTLNDELQERNDEIERVNDDLVNLLDSVDLPIVMLGRDLRIRRFTPSAEDALNLIPADVGRPMTDIRMPIDVDDLQDEIGEVLDSLETRETEIEGEEGGKWTLRIKPYRTSEDRIEGAVLVLLNRDEG